MKFSILVSLSAIFSIIAAAPSPRLQRRLERRAAARAGSTSHRVATSNKFKLDTHGKKGKSEDSLSNATVQYTSNWAGAVLTTPPTGQTFNYVAGTFTVPVPTIPSGVSALGDEDWSSTAWVGIDGDTCTTAILQTGVDFTVSQSGIPSYDAWYEWYPDYSYDFDITISAGDVITAYVQASSLTSGLAVIENQTTGETVSMDLNSTSSLCGTNAEWIVEDFLVGGSLIALADFGSVTFTGAEARTGEGSTLRVEGATVFGIETGNVVYTSTTLDSESQVTVNYI